MSRIEEALAASLEKVTKKFVREKRRAERQGQRDYLSHEQIERLRRINTAKKEEEAIKHAAWSVMAQAYAAASDNGSLPANARQIMYAARPLVLKLTKDKCWKNSGYFTQVLLPNYLADHPDETIKWDVVFDARGHFTEPHVTKQVAIGTLDVRGYVNAWDDGSDVDSEIEPPHVDGLFLTSGP